MRSEKPVNILIVDDRQANIVALEAILKCPEYNLVSATSGTEALKRVLKDDFAVILLDVMMPEMDGFEFARLVRKGGRGESTPIIFLTAIAKDSSFLHKGYGVGAVDYMHKPLDPVIVQAKVSVFVDLYRKNVRIKEQEAQLRVAERLQSERHYKELCESIPQIVWTADTAGKLEYLNGKFYTYSGLACPEGGTKGDWHVCHSAMHPDDVLLFLFAWSRSLGSGQPLELECRLKGADGMYRWHLCRGVAEKGDSGHILNWLGTFTDIHAQKRSQEIQKFLAESNETLSATHDYKQAVRELCRQGVPGMADACVVDLLDDAGRPERVACSVRSDADPALLIEISRRTPIPGHASLAFAPAFESERMVMVQRVDPSWADSVADPVEREHLQAIPIGVLSAPIQVNGKMLGAISILSLNENRRLDSTDVYVITEGSRHIAIALQNARLRAEQEKTNKMKDEFLAVLSHELRTPLNTVIGWADLLAQKCVDKAMLKGLRVIERSGRTLAQLVGDLLDVSRIITGKLELDLRPMDLHQILAETIEACQLGMEKKKITVSQVFAHETPIVMADHSRIQQILSNLLGNALKFTPDGGHIDVRTVVQGDRLQIRIADSGIGIKEETLPIIFEAFRQADSSTTRTYGGLGLGLSIVKHLTELHHGNVAASSDGPGKGAVFTVTMPLVMETTQTVERSFRSVSPAQESLAGTSVIVVDDDRESRELVATLLRRGGAEVRSVGSVLEALDSIRERLPDVVLTDIGMPDHDGFDLIRMVRDYEQESGVKVRAGALTAYASPEDALRVKQAGFEVHIAKPVRAKELIAAVVMLAAKPEDSADTKTAIH